MKYIKEYKEEGMTFKEWLKNHPKDININYINCSYENLIDLNGIEEFKNLKIIICNNNKLTKLPDLSNLKKIEKLYCYSNKLTELPDLFELKRLQLLYCDNNNLPFKCTKNKNNLPEYLEWYKKTYPWKWEANKYNL